MPEDVTAEGTSNSESKRLSEEELLKTKQTCESLKTVKEPGKDTFFSDLFYLRSIAPKLIDEIEYLRESNKSLQRRLDGYRSDWLDREDYECEF